RLLIIPAAVAANILVVGVLIFFSSSEGIEMFNNFFGTSIDAFTMGRTDFLKSLLNSEENLKKGFGYTTYYLRNVVDYPNFKVMHGEQIKLYFETGLTGVIAFFAIFYAGVRNSRILYFTFVLNVLFIFNHILDSAANMFVFYMIIGYAGSKEKLEECAEDRGRKNFPVKERLINFSRGEGIL
ncbi:MAG: hypothetical protein GX660_04960, partial [Clostridiaceae bacterium]|nr:hypothetical protein [Clostridiaceae bacterium]